MARLPTLDSLGGRPVPVSRRGVAGNSQAGAVGGAVAEFGDRVARIGAEKFQQLDQLEYAEAKTMVARADMELRRQIEEDGDFETAEKRYADGMANARKAATARISNRGNRSIFETDAEGDFNRGMSAVSSTVSAKRKVAGRARLLTNIDGLQDVASVADDEATRANGIKTADMYIKSAQEFGLIDPMEAAERREAFAGNLAISWTAKALADEDTDAAKAVLARYGQFIPTPQRDALTAQVGRIERNREEMSVADAVMGDVAPPATTATTAPASTGPSPASKWRVISSPGAPRDGGRRSHAGYDIAPQKGAEGWHPTQAFRVENPRNGGAKAGLTVDVVFKDGTRLKLMHLAELPKAGEYEAGQLAAIAGTTGNAKGGPVHFHVEGMDARGNRIDPSRYFAAGTGGGAAKGARSATPTPSLGDALANVDQWAANETAAGRPPTPEAVERIKGLVVDRFNRNDSVKARDEGEAADEAAEVVAGLGDDFTSIDQIPADVRGRMSPQARLQATDRASENKRRKEAATADLNNYTTATNTPGFTWNPYDRGHVDAVEAGVKARGGTPEAALQVYQQTGVLAPSGAIAIRGGLASADPARRRVAMNVAGNILRTNPNAFAAVPGGEDIAKQAAEFNHYTYDLGMDPEDAAARVAKDNAPDARSRTQITDAQVTQIRTDIRKTGAPTPASIFGSGAVFGDDGTRVRFGNEYAELVIDAVRNGSPNIAAAKAAATQQMQRSWGVTKGGGVVKYPPERGYPAIGGSHDYVYRDAIETVKTETGRKPTTIRLAPIPGLTDEDFRAGRRPRYRIVYSYLGENGQRVYDSVPGIWAADVAAPKAKADADARAGFGRARADRQRGLDEAARAKAAVGGDYLSDPFDR
jgi:hypothetical protein